MQLGIAIADNWKSISNGFNKAWGKVQESYPAIAQKLSNFIGLYMRDGAAETITASMSAVVAAMNGDYGTAISSTISALLNFLGSDFGKTLMDMHIIHRSKEVLLKVLEGVKTIAAEYGLILNEKKTHICKLSSDYRYLQVKYTLLQNGVVVRRIHPKAITRERRKLKAYKHLLDKGIVTIEEIDGYFRSWLSGNYKYMSRDQIYKMNSLYVKLFGRSVTWKKGHGRLRWLMAHPSAA